MGRRGGGGRGAAGKLRLWEPEKSERVKAASWACQGRRGVPRKFHKLGQRPASPVVPRVPSEEQGCGQGRQREGRQTTLLSCLHQGGTEGGNDIRERSLFTWVSRGGKPDWEG